jgi:hypothetical protein
MTSQAKCAIHFSTGSGTLPRKELMNQDHFGTLRFSRSARAVTVQELMDHKSIQMTVRLHQPMPVPQQLSQIPILRARYPDLRGVIFQHQPEQESSILAVVLLLFYSLALDLCGIADPQLET